MNSIFKYRKIDDFTFRLLAKQEIHFSFPKDFNDPFDSVIRLDPNSSNDDWIKWIEHLKDQEMAKRLVLHIKEGKTKPKPDEYLMKNNMLVCSFSAKNDETLMWSHYADNHKGICIGFTVHSTPHGMAMAFENKGFRDPSKDGKGLRLDEVTYSKYTPQPLSAFIDEESANILMKSWLLTKHENWGYEQEYRILVLRDWVFTHTLQFYKPSLKSISFGVSTEEYYKEIIRKIVEMNYVGQDVEFYQAVPKQNSYLIEMQRE